MSQSSAKGVNVPVSGDLTGSLPNPTVAAINGTAVPASPAANTVLTATSGIASVWQQVTNAQISSSAAIVVSKLAAGISGQILQNNGTPTPTWTTISGDVAITNTGATTVTAIQNFPVSATAPTSNQVLEWNGSAYVPTTITATLAGDVTGPIGSNTVINIHGASVPVAGSLTTGNVLQVSGSSALSYGAVNLAGGANFVTGVLPTGNQANQAMGGDVTGTTNSSTVAKIQGNTVTSGALTKGQFFIATSTSNWAATTLSGDISESNVTPGLLTVTGVQGNTFTSGAPTKGQFVIATSATNYGPVTISGDVSESNSTAGLLTVIGIDGYAISGGPISGQILEYNGTNLVWVTPSSGVTWASDLAGSTNSNQWVTAISGNAGAGGSIPVNATTLAFASGQSTPAVNQTALGSVATTGATGQTLTINAQAGQPTTGAGNNAGNGGILTLTSGAGGTASGGSPGVAGNLLLQTGGTTQATVSTSGFSVTTLAGSGSGFVAVNNTGLLSFVAGISPTGSAGGDLGGSYPNPTVVAIQTNPIQAGVLGASQDGYVLSWKNSATQWQALPITSGSVTLAGDVTGVATSNNVVSISGATPIVITPTEFQWKNSTTNPLIDQAALASTSSGSGIAGQNFTHTAQAGQAATGATNNGGNGGNLILIGGAGGTSGSATAGKDGNVQITAGTTNIATFYDYDFNGDGYVDAVALGSGLTTPQVYQTALTTTSSGNGSVGQFLYLMSQAGQAAIGGVHNGGNGGNLVLASGAGGTSGGGTPGTAGNLLLQTGNTTQTTITPTSITMVPSVTLSSLAGNGVGVVAVSNTGVLSFTTSSAGTPQVKNTTYTVLTTDGDIFADLSSTGWTLTLPSSPVLGEKHTIKDFDGYAGQSTVNGTTATLTLVSTTVTLTGGSGFTSAMNGLNITISSATTTANNGTFVLTFISSSSVSWTNASGATDANNGHIVWSVANNLIISGNGKTIEQWGGSTAAASTLLLTQNYDAVTLTYNGTNWSIC